MAATNRSDSCWAGFAPARRRRLSTAHWPFVDNSFFFCFREMRSYSQIRWIASSATTPSTMEKALTDGESGASNERMK